MCNICRIASRGQLECSRGGVTQLHGSTHLTYGSVLRALLTLNSKFCQRSPNKNRTTVTATQDRIKANNPHVKCAQTPTFVPDVQ
jgi:hypothetical protein